MQTTGDLNLKILETQFWSPCLPICQPDCMLSQEQRPNEVTISLYSSKLISGMYFLWFRQVFAFYYSLPFFYVLDHFTRSYGMLIG